MISTLQSVLAVVLTALPFELFAIWLLPGIQSTNKWLRTLVVTLIAFCMWLVVVAFISPQVIHELIVLFGCFLTLYVINFFYISHKRES
jgi:Ca2+/Na+ antiporter